MGARLRPVRSIVHQLPVTLQTEPHDARPSADAVEPAMLHHGLLEPLRELLVQGEIEAGSRIPERELCERFGVSRTPMREALKVLAAEGLVELLPNRGARVTRLDEGDLKHLFEVIGALEALAGRLACLRITEAELAEIQAMHYRMYACFLRRELPEYFSLNQAIHEAIVGATANPVLLMTYANLSRRIRRARYMVNRLSPERWHAAMTEHEAILEALQQRDGDRLGLLLSRHLENKSIAISEQIAP